MTRSIDRMDPRAAASAALAGRFAEAVGRLTAGDFATAETMLRAIRRQAPDHPDVSYNLAVVLARTHRPAEAVALLRRLVRLFPDFAAAFGLLGILRRDEGATATAVALLQRARALQPDHAVTANNLANSYVMAGRLDAAVATFREAIRLDPDLRPAYRNLAEILVDRGRGDAAVAALRAYLCRWPGDPGGWLELGGLYSRMRRDAATAMPFARAARLAPESDAVPIARLAAAVPMVAADIATATDAIAYLDAAILALIDRFRAASADRLAVAADQAVKIDSFGVAYSECDVTAVLCHHGDLVARLNQACHAVPGIAPRPRKSGGDRGRNNRRIRVAIVSNFFRRRHPVWKGLIGGWVSQLDRHRFTVIGYPTRSDDEADAVFARGQFDRVAPPQASIAAWIDRIAADQPDILIYPDGPMNAIAQRLSALRLAPVQCATWGHPATTGMPTVDAFLGADALEPGDADRHYRERLIRIANLGTYYRCETEGIVPRPRAWFGEPEAVTLYGCVQSLYKYLPQYDTVLPRIARTAGPCRFLFFEDLAPAVTAAFRARLAGAFAAAGLQCDDWCRFLPRMSSTDFYATVGALDVYLDTLGFSGFNTAMEALSFNVPVVTGEGRFLRARLASGILRRIGVTGTIAADPDAYVAIAAQLGRDRDQRLAISHRIDATKATAWNDRDAIGSLEAHLEALDRDGCG